MKLRPCGDVLLVELDDPEPEVVEFALDDAEAREELRMVLTPEEVRTRRAITNMDELRKSFRMPRRTHEDFGPRLKRSHG